MDTSCWTEADGQKEIGMYLTDTRILDRHNDGQRVIDNHGTSLPTRQTRPTFCNQTTLPGRPSRPGTPGAPGIPGAPGRPGRPVIPVAPTAPLPGGPGGPLGPS